MSGSLSTMPGATIERVDLNDQVYATLKDWLATRKLAPDDKLSLHELAAAFGVSRSPVQQALTRLVSEGLVSVEPSRGHFVTPLTPTIVVNAYDVRLALELRAAERTVGRLDRAQLAELRRLMERDAGERSTAGASSTRAASSPRIRRFHELPGRPRRQPPPLRHLPAAGGERPHGARSSATGTTPRRRRGRAPRTSSRRSRRPIAARVEQAIREHVETGAGARASRRSRRRGGVL